MRSELEQSEVFKLSAKTQLSTATKLFLFNFPIFCFLAENSRISICSTSSFNFPVGRWFLQTALTASGDFVPSWRYCLAILYHFTPPCIKNNVWKTWTGKSSGSSYKIFFFISLIIPIIWYHFVVTSVNYAGILLEIHTLLNIIVNY